MEFLSINCFSTVLFSLLFVLKEFSISSIAGIFVIIVLLFFSALISGSEMAFFSITPKQVKEIKTSKLKNYQKIIFLLERPKSLLATILISNNFINIAVVIISTYLTNKIFDFSDFIIVGFIIQFIVITSVILLLGEILPKIYAANNILSFAKLMSSPLKILMKLTSPLNFFMINSTVLIEKRLLKKNKILSFDELSEAIDITSKEKGQEHEKTILKGIVKFGETDVKEIMRSRTDVTFIDYDLKYKGLIDIIKSSGFSRLPVFRESIDDIVGVLYIKDLLGFLEKTDDFKWQQLIRPAYFVPENKKIDDLLAEFQLKKIHIAVVVDEYGGNSGIVTLEDILEEIVGDINDEYDDVDSFSHSKIDDNNFVFEGKVLVNDFCKIVGCPEEKFDEIKGESETLAGLLLEIKGKIPEKDELIVINNYTFRIISADNRRIKQVKVTINENKDVNS